MNDFSMTFSMPGYLRFRTTHSWSTSGMIVSSRLRVPHKSMPTGEIASYKPTNRGKPAFSHFAMKSYEVREFIGAGRSFPSVIRPTLCAKPASE